MRRIAAALLLITMGLGLSEPASAETIGIVLMHGKTGSPDRVIDGLATALRGAGYVVDTPEMCWSRRRIYDRPFLDCLTEIDAAVARLKAKGTVRIVIAGMSQGGDAALVYGASRGGLTGIVALAPAAAPERENGRADIARSVAEARAMVAAGRGNETASFAEANNGGSLTVRATAAIYLSYVDPQGPANMLAAVRSVRVPLLWVAGAADPSQTGAQSEFAQAPANPLSRFVAVSSTHLGTPDAAREAVLTWLPTLR